MTAAGTRARVRAELTREIVEVARRHLASAGAAALSLRAVARELGMASSAVYRYFPSRDDLLTALIVDAYDAVGAAAERAEAAVDQGDLRGRWRAACTAVRAWALAHPHEYALVYGSPVPGYAAPEATIAPAGRVGIVLCRVLADGAASGALPSDTPPGTSRDTAAPNTPVPNTAASDVAVPDVAAPDVAASDPLAPGVAESLGLPQGLAAVAVLGWSSLFGAISFELFGHTHNVVLDHRAHFDASVDRLADLVGLP